MAASGEGQAIRQAAGLSLGEFGRGAGLSHVTVLRYERGERRPTGDSALRYAELLDRLAAVSRAEPESRLDADT
ncbi:MAG TPA: helix-turn-helix transcriptional regulator [Aquihabitans sp.]|jgi:transcriptional regulator with XRE-family HTH domain|nr:helix-turn-helix transcriptional regulator [Aquihabitans sp.]